MVTACLATLLLAGASRPAQSDSVPALAVQYADGRRTVIALSSSGRVSYTQTFPRIAGADTSRDGLPLFAIQYEEAREPNGLALTVALLYGNPFQRRVPVETVHLTASTPARVNGLEAFGIRPVDFSLVSLPSAQLIVPSVISVASALEVRMETVTDPTPGYYATIVNRSDRDVMSLKFTTFAGKRLMTTGSPHTPDNTPLIPARGSYLMKLRANANASAREGESPWVLIDRLEISSVRWADGVVEGNAEWAAHEYALDAGLKLQLDRLIGVLRAAARQPADHSLSALRAEVEALTLAVSADETAAAAETLPGTVHLPAEQIRPNMAGGMRNARSAVLNDIDELLHAPAPQAEAYAAWLTRMTDKYAAWRARIR
jgi:hypothetical protein